MLAGRKIPNLIERMVNMCKQNSCNNVIALILSVIIGIGISVLFSCGLLANICIALWISLLLSIISLVALFVFLPLSSTNIFSSLKKCICKHGKSLIVGSIGTLVTTIAALSLPVCFYSVLIILFFLIGTFLSFLIISIAKFLFCLLIDNCCKHIPCCKD